MVAVSSVNSSEMKVSDSPICSRIHLSVQPIGTDATNPKSVA